MGWINTEYEFGRRLKMIIVSDNRVGLCQEFTNGLDRIMKANPGQLDKICGYVSWFVKQARPELKEHLTLEHMDYDPYRQGYALLVSHPSFPQVPQQLGQRLAIPEEYLQPCSMCHKPVPYGTNMVATEVSKGKFVLVCSEECAKEKEGTPQPIFLQ